jgi:type II secretory pathway pseudopilin PulG
MKIKAQKGIALLEVIVALALLGITGVLFMSGVANSAKARVLADEHASAKVLAESIADTIKKMDYAGSYEVAVPEGYEGYSADIETVDEGAANMEKITIAISRNSRVIYTLESYKVNR